MLFRSQAYAQANEVVMIATKQAQEILDNATNEANNIRMGAMSYTDEQLRGIEEILTHSIDTSRARYENLLNSLQGYLDVVSRNRTELFPAEPEPEEEMPKTSESAPSDKAADIDMSNVTIETNPSNE